MTRNFYTLIMCFALLAIQANCGKGTSFAGRSSLSSQKGNLAQVAEATKDPDPQPTVTPTNSPTPTATAVQELNLTSLICEKLDISKCQVDKACGTSWHGCALRNSDKSLYTTKIDEWNARLTAQTSSTSVDFEAALPTNECPYHMVLCPGATLDNIAFSVASGGQTYVVTAQFPQETSPINTPTPTATPGIKIPNSAGLWYLSAAGASCDDTCKDHGGYNESTSTFAGSGANTGASTDQSLNCRIALFQLNGTSMTYIEKSYSCGAGLGCNLYNSTPPSRWCYSHDEATTASAKADGVKRACACNQ